MSAVTSKFYKSQGNQISDPSPSVSGQGSSVTTSPSAGVENSTDDLRKRSDAEPVEDAVQWGDMNVRVLRISDEFHKINKSISVLKELSLSSSAMDFKENGDGWDVQEEWAPIEDFEQLSFSKTNVSSRSKDSLPMVKDTAAVPSSKNVMQTAVCSTFSHENCGIIRLHLLYKVVFINITVL